MYYSLLRYGYTHMQGHQPSLSGRMQKACQDAGIQLEVFVVLTVP